jgi:hypothetical protein
VVRLCQIALGESFARVVDDEGGGLRRTAIVEATEENVIDNLKDLNPTYKRRLIDRQPCWGTSHRNESVSRLRRLRGKPDSFKDPFIHA